jgi:hypothetical protein
MSLNRNGQQQCAKCEFASSNTTRTTFAFDACFVWKLAHLADERSGFFIENLSRRLTRLKMYYTLQTRTWPTGQVSSYGQIFPIKFVLYGKVTEVENQLEKIDGFV